MENKNNKKIKSCNLIDNFNLKWSIKILLLSFALSVSFSILSDTILTSTSFYLAIMIIFFLVLIGTVSDLCGVAITSCNLERFLEMKEKNVKNAEIGIKLIKNSDKISVICCDIVGDICSILSGACGASIVYKIITSGTFEANTILVSSCVSGIIACITIFCKSLEKSFAVSKNEQITLFIAKCINFIKK